MTSRMPTCKAERKEFKWTFLTVFSLEKKLHSFLFGHLVAADPSIHPSSVHILCTPLNPLQGRGGAGAYPSWLRAKAGDTLDRSPVHRRAVAADISSKYSDIWYYHLIELLSLLSAINHQFNGSVKGHLSIVWEVEPLSFECCSVAHEAKTAWLHRYRNTIFSVASKIVWPVEYADSDFRQLSSWLFLTFKVI